MKVNQIYSLLNDINAQMFGEDALDVHDLSGIISMGQSIVGDGTATDKRSEEHTSELQSRI